MGKLNKLFILSRILLSRPGKIRRLLDDDSYWQDHVRKAWGHAALPVLDLLKLFPSLVEKGIEVEPYTFLEGGSMLTDLAVLRLFARQKQGCKYFEIGTWRGESVVNVAAEGAECHTLNLSLEQMLEVGYDEVSAAQVGLLIKEKENIHLYRNDSKHFDFSSIGKKFDLIFIDGDHHYDAVKRDSRNIVEHLCHDKTIICWHDYAYNPEAVRHEVMAGILDGIPESMHKGLRHISNTKLAVYLPGVAEGQDFVSPPVIDKLFHVKISACRRG